MAYLSGEAERCGEIAHRFRVAGSDATHLICMSECSVTSQLELVEADIGAYRALERFHYRDGGLGPTCAVYALAERCLRRRKTDDFAGVIVYGPAAMNSAARDAATGGYFAGHSKPDKLALLNGCVRRISRVIIEPRYRGLGLGVRLVRETLGQVGAAMVEAMAVMGQVHPFFERAGMRAFAPTPDAAREHLQRVLAEAGIDESLWIDPPAAEARLAGLAGRSREVVETAMRLFLNRFGRRRTMAQGLERTAFILSCLGEAPRYYAWLNPDRKVQGLELQQ